MSPTITLILDLVIAGLLVATIIYAIQLNRQLIRLRDGRGEMEGLIRSFNDATIRAETGIKAMRRATAETAEGLQRSVERAQALRDELQFLVEAADSLARRLAEAPTQAKGATQAAAPSRRPPSPLVEDSQDSPRARAQELLRGLGQEVARAQAQEQSRGRGGLTRGESGPSRGPRLPDVDEGHDLPRGRGALTRGEPPPSRGARLADLLDTSQDLPRGRGVLTRGDGFAADPPGRGEAARPEPGRGPGSEPPGRGERRSSEPPRRDGTEGLSRAERELLQAIESRR
ncbi:MAG: DUF6468 domain-containing protein [Rhodospirillaceae bacterium]